MLFIGLKQRSEEPNPALSTAHSPTLPLSPRLGQLLQGPGLSLRNLPEPCPWIHRGYQQLNTNAPL